MGVGLEFLIKRQGNFFCLMEFFLQVELLLLQTFGTIFLFSSSPKCFLGMSFYLFFSGVLKQTQVWVQKESPSWP